MTKTRSKQGSDEWGSCSNVSKTIVNKIIEGSLGYCANVSMLVSSPMSKTTSNKGRNFSYVSKINEKQGKDGIL